MTKEVEDVESERPATDRTGSIGIIGAGNIGQALARTALRAGREVVIANSRGPESLAPVVAALGAGVSASTVPEAAAAGIVAIAVRWTSVPAAVTGLQWDGQAVIDATNAFNADLGGRTSSEIVAGLVPGARLVKAANTLEANVLGADPHEAGGRRVIFLSGDDAPAKATVVELFAAAGFFPIDLGDLVTGGRMQQVGGPLPAHNLVRLPPSARSQDVIGGDR
jgi:8-hydroxy-5-deazaflavin:NADPH oxidoreductase